MYFSVELHLRTHLRPLVCLRVVSFDGTEIYLSVIPADGKETVPKETNANRVSADAHRGDSCPHVCLRVIPAKREREGDKEAEAPLKTASR